MQIIRRKDPGEEPEREGTRGKLCLVPVSLGPISNHLGFVSVEARLFKDAQVPSLAGTRSGPITLEYCSRHLIQLVLKAIRLI